MTAQLHFRSCEPKVTVGQSRAGIFVSSKCNSAAAFCIFLLSNCLAQIWSVSLFFCQVSCCVALERLNSSAQGQERAWGSKKAEDSSSRWACSAVTITVESTAQQCLIPRLEWVEGRRGNKWKGGIWNQLFLYVARSWPETFGDISEDTFLKVFSVVSAWQKRRKNEWSKYSCECQPCSLSAAGTFSLLSLCLNNWSYSAQDVFSTQHKKVY